MDAQAQPTSVECWEHSLACELGVADPRGEDQAIAHAAWWLVVSRLVDAGLFRDLLATARCQERPWVALALLLKDAVPASVLSARRVEWALAAAAAPRRN